MICICVAAIGKRGAPFAVLLALAMVIGAALSTFNGLFITKLKIPAIVAALATTHIFQGILPLTSEGSISGTDANQTAWEAAIDELLKTDDYSFIKICILSRVETTANSKYAR